MVVYQSHICCVGNEVAQMANNQMLILFQYPAPSSLAEYCVEHEGGQLIATLKKGDQLYFGKDRYTISTIGSRASELLSQLGHVTLVFDQSSRARAEGCIHLEEPFHSLLIEKMLIQLDHNASDECVSDLESSVFGD